MKAEQKHKKSILKTVFGLFFSAAVVASAITIPIVVSNHQTISFHYNYSNTLEGNKNKVNDYLNTLKSNNSILSNSLKIYGNSNIIGEDGVELTSEQRSFVTIEQCFENGMFQFVVPSNLRYNLRKNGIEAQLAYVRSDYSTEATYPIIGIKFYSGSGSSYFETIFEYRETSLCGFKKNNQQLFINQIIDDIKSNPKNFFVLKDTVGTIGQIGLYAKNITTTDFNLDTTILRELRNNNFFISITGVNVDPYNRSNLKLHYDIVYNDGNSIAYKTYNEVVLEGFDVEIGVDDPASVVKNYIQSNSDYLNNLNQYFTYKTPTSSEDGTEPVKVSAREAYQNNEITFEPTYSVISKLETDGIEIVFKMYEEENSSELNVYNSPLDSTTPMYRLYISSYSGTPLKYTESIVIEGTEQSNDFKISQQELDMQKVLNYLDEQNTNFENFIEIDWSQITFENDLQIVKAVNEIPFSIFYNAFTKYIEDPKVNKPPFTLKVKRTNALISNNEIDTIMNSIVDSMNSLAINELIENQQNQIYLNVTIGEFENNLYMDASTLLLMNFENVFASEETYSNNELNSLKTYIESKPNEVIVNLNEDNGPLSTNIIIENMRNYAWDKIFKSITLANSPSVIKFPEYESTITIAINYQQLNSLSKTEIETIIQNQAIDVPIILIKDKYQVGVTIHKTFDELLNN